jgi:3-dehydroquinate synthetase/DNA-binding NarL/FixJ family response regulator
MNFLIVDDSKMIRHIVCKALNELGYHLIAEAGNVNEAKRLMIHEKFDCIISDWHMPGESGLDFLKFVKSSREHAKIPFILQTTESEKKCIVEAVKAGVQGYLFKPVQKDALAQKLTELARIYPIQPPSIKQVAAKPATLQAAKVKDPQGARDVSGGESAASSDVVLRPFSEVVTQLSGDGGTFSFESAEDAAKPFNISMGNDRSEQLLKSLGNMYPDARFVIMVDSQTALSCDREMKRWESELGCLTINVPDISKNRTVAFLSSVAERLVENKMDSSSVMIAFGGAPLINLAGFVAALFRGGMRLVVVPLSLADFLDCSVVSSWTIDVTGAQSAFVVRHDPAMLWFDISSVMAMPGVEFSYACSEIFRYGFFGGGEFIESINAQWKQLLNKIPETFVAFLRLCVGVRASIDSSEMDTMHKKIALDFSRPVSKALLRHSGLGPGQATSLAIACMCEAAKKAGTLAKEQSGAYIELIQKMPLFQLEKPLDSHKILATVIEEASRMSGRPLIALPATIGNVAIHSLPEDAFFEAFKGLLCPPTE